MDFNAIIDAAHEATDKHGVKVTHGKKYSQVVTRVELFKRHLPEWGLDTTVIHLGIKPGDPVVVKAIITDKSGRVKGAGTAGEIIGAGNVNKTSALENAETSAIGRALASIGIAGGEYASLNEVEGAQRKEEAQQENIEARIARDRQRLEAAENRETLHATFGMIGHEWGAQLPAELVELKSTRYAKFARDDLALCKAKDAFDETCISIRDHFGGWSKIPHELMEAIKSKKAKFPEPKETDE